MWAAVGSKTAVNASRLNEAMVRRHSDRALEMRSLVQVSLK